MVSNENGCMAEGATVEVIVLIEEHEEPKKPLKERVHLSFAHLPWITAH